MSTARIRGLLLGLTTAAVTTVAGHAAEPAGPVRDLVDRVMFWLDHPQEPPVPRAVPTGGTEIRLDDLSDPDGLERQLRREAARDLPRLSLLNGVARLGNYALGTTDSIAGHLLVLRGNAEIFGHVTGNVVSLDGDIVVHPGGRLDGDALALAGEVRDAAGGVGGVSRALSGPRPTATATAGPAGVLVRGAGVLGVFLTLLALGFAVVTFARPSLEVVSDTVTHSLGRAFAVGVLAEILVLPTFGMLVVGLALTIVGVVLIPFTVVAYVLLLLTTVVMGLIAVAHSMGENHARRQMAMGVRISPNSYRYLVTGLTTLLAVWVAWFLFSWVPVAGGLILAAAVIATWLLATLGFGASILSRVGIRSDFAGRIVPPEALTDEYLWATPQFGVPAATRPPKDPPAKGE